MLNVKSGQGKNVSICVLFTKKLEIFTKKKDKFQNMFFHLKIESF